MDRDEHRDGHRDCGICGKPISLYDYWFFIFSGGQRHTYCQDPYRGALSRPERAPIYHRDGSLTYWSVFQQTWVERTRYISDAELAARPAAERDRMISHLRAPGSLV